MIPTLFQRILLGINRSPRQVLTEIFLAYSASWTLLEAFLGLVNNSNLHNPHFPGILKYTILVASSIFIGIYRSIPPFEEVICLKNTNTTIRLQFGDLFKSEGQKVIGVNEFFDSLLGDHVSEFSLHGQFIKNQLGGQSSSFDDLVRMSLAKTDYTEVKRASGNIKKYKIGTTALVSINNEDYYLVALCHTDIDTLKACSDINTFWRALEGLWERVRAGSGGKTVNVPLLGNGLSKLGLPPQQIIQLILISFLIETKRSMVAQEIRIILPFACYDQIDLSAIAREWN